MSIKAFSLIEVFISLFILTTALLGLLQMQVFSWRYQHEAQIMVEASNLLIDLNLMQLFDAAGENDCLKQSQKRLPEGNCQLINQGSLLTWQVPNLGRQMLTIRF